MSARTRRRTVGALAALVVAAGTAIAFVAFQRLGNETVKGELASYRLVDAETVSVTINVTRDDPVPVSDSLRVIERFKRTGAHTLAYEKTVDDPQTWTQPWKVAFEITEDPTYPLYEYACHEGNYGLVNILKGARAAERAAKNSKGTL